ncbi:MAG TPA: monovalent cation/H+ antiporter complex subunit F [Acidimicrobiales bacterium]|nr:monovalent cation/H+ antiporter complex subunit F [Acidimicrobiales bacterium]
MTTLALALLGLAVLCFGYRTVAGPSLSDRMTGVNGMLTSGMAAVVVHAVSTNNGAFLPVLVVVALVGFVGTGMMARFIEGHGR